MIIGGQAGVTGKTASEKAHGSNGSYNGDGTLILDGQASVTGNRLPHPGAAPMGHHLRQPDAGDPQAPEQSRRSWPTGYPSHFPVRQSRA